MEIICNAGEARSLCYEALRLARTRSFEQAEEKRSFNDDNSGTGNGD
ncbi:PTS system cellobiose-specific transporter subunit IIA [Vibrio cholerae]|nr:PTS system cellobiose-specific transporter subunit IIA [Vibrio cholerae]